MNNIIERCPRCGYYVSGVVSASDRQKQFGKSLASLMYGNSMANLCNNPFMRLPYAKLAYDNMSKNDGPQMYEFRCSCGCSWKSDGRGSRR